MLVPKAFQVTFVLQVILYTLSIGTYFVRRKKFPIAQRIPYIAICETSFHAVLSMVVVLQAAFPENETLNSCIIWTYITTFCDHIPAIMISYRMGYLIMKDFVTKMLVENQAQFIGREPIEMSKSDSKDSEPKIGGSYSLKIVERFLIFLIRRYGPHRTTIVLVAPGWIVAAVDLVLVLTKAIPSSIPLLSTSCFENVVQLTMLMKFAILVYLGSAFLAVFLAIFRMDDHFKIGLELRILVFLAALLSVLIVLLSFLNTFQLLHTLCMGLSISVKFGQDINFACSWK
jgi:hypothetical protein